MNYYIRPYTIKEVVSTNTIKLKLPTTMSIYLVMNISQVVQYQEPMKKQSKPVEVDREKEQEVEKILNKRKIRGVVKYLV